MKVAIKISHCQKLDDDVLNFSCITAKEELILSCLNCSLASSPPQNISLDFHSTNRNHVDLCMIIVIAKHAVRTRCSTTEKLQLKQL